MCNVSIIKSVMEYYIEYLIEHFSSRYKWQIYISYDIGIINQIRKYQYVLA